MENANDEQINKLLGLVFDLDHLSNTIHFEGKKPHNLRNYVQEDTYNSIYHVSYNSLSCYDYLNLPKAYLY